MFVLGIESTAHTFGVGIVDAEGTVLADAKSIYSPIEGGIHPREAAEHHQQSCLIVLQKALDQAGVSLGRLGAVAFSQGPGLPPSLRVGAVMARGLAYSLNIPLLGVNHCLAHVEQARYFSKVERPLVVYLSGGNTQLTTLEGNRYRILGETLDIALGNMLDMFGRAAKLAHPGGPKIEKLARQADGTYLPLPYTVKGMDLAFSGLLTAAKRLLKEGADLTTVCYSLQETSFAMTAEVVERALAHTQRTELLATGGVAANNRLCEMLQIVAQEQSACFASVPPKYAGDNGVMIAYTGLLLQREKIETPLSDSHVLPKWRIDQVEIAWE